MDGGKNSKAILTIGAPGCPLLAFWTTSAANALMVLTHLVGCSVITQIYKSWLSICAHPIVKHGKGRERERKGSRRMRNKWASSASVSYAAVHVLQSK